MYNLNTVSLTKSQIIFIFVLGAVLLAAAWYTYQNYLQSGPVAEDSAAFTSLGVTTEAAYTDVDGNPVNLSEYLGKTLIVYSWASWSPFSAADLETLSLLASQYSSEQVVILAINRAESKEIAASFLRVNGIKDGVQLVLDKDDVFYKSINGFSMPETVVFDKAGDIVLQHRGAVVEDRISVAVDQALAQ